MVNLKSDLREGMKMRTEILLTEIKRACTTAMNEIKYMAEENGRDPKTTLSYDDLNKAIDIIDSLIRNG